MACASITEIRFYDDVWVTLFISLYFATCYVHPGTRVRVRVTTQQMTTLVPPRHQPYHAPPSRSRRSTFAAATWRGVVRLTVWRNDVMTEWRGDSVTLRISRWQHHTTPHRPLPEAPAISPYHTCYGDFATAGRGEVGVGMARRVVICWVVTLTLTRVPVWT